MGSFADTTYPREGTETSCIVAEERNGEDTTYPREGTETRRILHQRCAPGDTTYPREGTETLHFVLQLLQAILTQLIPARGRKHKAMRELSNYR